MNNETFRTELNDLGLKQTDIARLFEVTPRTVNKWAQGELRVPGCVSAYLKLYKSLSFSKRCLILKQLGKVK